VFKNLELWFLNTRFSGTPAWPEWVIRRGFKFAMIAQKEAIPKVASALCGNAATATAGSVPEHPVIPSKCCSARTSGNTTSTSTKRAIRWETEREGYDVITYRIFVFPSADREVGIHGRNFRFQQDKCRDAGDDDPASCATYNVSPRLILDAGAYFAVYGNLPRVTFFGGVTYSIADLYTASARKP